MRLMRIDETMAKQMFASWQANAPPTQPIQPVTAPAPAAFLPTPGKPCPSPDQAPESQPEAPQQEPAAEITTLDVQAHAAATSPFNAIQQPTEAQKQAGNYAKGHLKFDGLDLSMRIL